MVVAACLVLYSLSWVGRWSTFCIILPLFASFCHFLHLVAPCCTLLHLVAPCCTILYRYRPLCCIWWSYLAVATGARSAPSDVTDLLQFSLPYLVAPGLGALRARFQEWDLTANIVKAVVLAVLDAVVVGCDESELGTRRSIRSNCQG